MKIFFAGNTTWAGHELILPDRLYSYHTLITGSWSKVFRKTWLSGEHFRSFYFRDMELFFAGGENGSWQEIIQTGGGDAVLLSYQYLTGRQQPDAVLKFTNPRLLFIDSGAFSAFASGVEVDINQYIDFLQKYAWAYDICAGLDVIGDWKATLKNQTYMETRGLHPLWTFHRGEPFDLLKEQIQERDFIALGGMAQSASRRGEFQNWLDRCFSIIKDSVRVHGFGITTPSLMIRYPFYSVDSTTYLGGSKRASVYFWDPVRQIITEQCAHAKKTSDHRTIAFNDEVIQGKGWRERVTWNVREFLKMQIFVKESWKRRGIDWDQRDEEKGKSIVFNKYRQNGKNSKNDKIGNKNGR